MKSVSVQVEQYLCRFLKLDARKGNLHTSSTAYLGCNNYSRRTKCKCH